MRNLSLFLSLSILALAPSAVHAQTEGSARLEVTLLDYNGSSTKHYAVVWVTTAAGGFIETLWKQGPSWTSSQWSAHCATWNTARAGSTVLDGYTSATAANYAGTNSPIILAWKCRNASGQLLPDGAYKFWVQYAEDQSTQGPVTTGGLSWTKGPSGATNSYPNQGANFANLRVTWTPATPATVAPAFTSSAPPGGTVGVPYSFLCTASGTTPITFSATGLPGGLQLSAAGAISGIPAAAGTYAGAITAANGTLPDASQPFSMVINLVPLQIASVRTAGSNLVLDGTGPANGIYQVLTALNLATPSSQWSPLATNLVNSAGQFSFTNALEAGATQKYYQLRLP